MSFASATRAACFSFFESFATSAFWRAMWRSASAICLRVCATGSSTRLALIEPSLADLPDLVLSEGPTTSFTSRLQPETVPCLMSSRQTRAWATDPSFYLPLNGVASDLRQTQPRERQRSRQWPVSATFVNGLAKVWNPPTAADFRTIQD